MLTIDAACRFIPGNQGGLDNTLSPAQRACAQVALCLFTMPLIAFMIATADWLILIVLGQEWMAASQMCALLGISGLVEPFSYTTGWLFQSQGQTRQQFHWGIVNTVITVGAILIGMPWGPTGVAASYGIMGPFIRTPLLFWVVGRNGAIRTRDLYHDVAPFACASAATLAALFLFRQWSAVDQPWLGLLLASGITAVVSLLTITCFPLGRQTLQDLRSLPALVMQRKASA